MILEDQNTFANLTGAPTGGNNPNSTASENPVPQQPTISSVPQISPNVLSALRNHTSNEEIKAFIRMLPNFESVFPDALSMHIMRRSGITSPSEASARCLGIATQKFISDILNDALVLTELREEARNGGANRGTFVLTQDVIKEVLSHRGIFIDAFH
uniref:Transcription initiation factor TFIID subunit 10 n=1 Tax=Panagrolaimus sp. ES5 TaxID=591445 RepID=A0AC34FMN3_9BILA